MPVRCCLTLVTWGVLLIVSASTRASAQRMEPLALTPVGVTASPFQAPREPINSSRGVAGGILGGGIGLVAGFYAGASWRGESKDNCGPCGLFEGIWGAAVGESIGLAIGTHYGARANGSVALTALATTGIGVAGLAAAFAAENRGAPLILAVTPVVQLAVALALER